MEMQRSVAMAVRVQLYIPASASRSHGRAPAERRDHGVRNSRDHQNEAAQGHGFESSNLRSRGDHRKPRPAQWASAAAACAIGGTNDMRRLSMIMRRLPFASRQQHANATTPLAHEAFLQAAGEPQFGV